jgi:hypothetical protein
MALDLGSMESYSIQQEIDKRRTDAKDAIRAEQRELNVALGAAGESLIAVDGIVGPETEGARIRVGELKDGPDGPPEDDLPEEKTTRPDKPGADDPRTLAFTGTQHWVYNEAGGFWDIGGVAGKEKKKPPKPGTGDDEDPGAAKYLKWLKDNNALSAKAVIEGYLGAFELDGLATWVQENIKLGYNAEVMLMQLRYGDSKADEFLEDGRRNPMYIKQEYRNIYDDRFPGMAMRREKKMTPITEADYIDLERGYTQISNAAKIGSTFLWSVVDFTGYEASGITRLIGGDVSLAEFRTRVALAEEAANNADPEVIKILRDKYNFTGGDIVSSFLDPEGTKSVVEMRRNLGAAGLMFESGQALGTGKRFSTELSDKLYDMDVQRREIAAVMSPLAGLTGGTLTDAALTSTQLGQGAFGTNQASTVALRRKREGRSTRFQGRSGMLASAQGIAFGGTST